MKKSLREFRVEAGMSKRAFAIWLGVPYTSYIRYENNGVGSASFSEVIRICKQLGITSEEIK